MYLNLAVLKALSEGQKSGYDLMKYLYEHAGWKVSPGSIYPLLNSMLKKGEVTQKIKGRKKFYIITTKGKKTLEESKKLKDKMIKQAKSSIRVMTNLHGMEDASLMSDLIERFASSDAPFGDLTFDMINFRKTLFEFILDLKRFSRNKSQFKKILDNTAKKISRLK